MFPCWFSRSRIIGGKQSRFRESQLSAAHRVKSFYEFDKGSIECLYLFLKFSLELTKDEHCVYHASVGSDAILTLEEVFFGYDWHEPVEQDSGKFFVCDREWGIPR